MAQPLARYVPAEGLTVLLEHNGLAAQPQAWKGTAAYRMLNETSLGDARGHHGPGLDRGLQGPCPGNRSPARKWSRSLTQLANNGFVVGYRGTRRPTGGHERWWS